MGEWLSANFIDEAATFPSYLVSFHDFTLLVLTFIVVLVMAILGTMDYSPYLSKTAGSHHSLEFIWTALPVLVLLTVAIPSLTLLFMMEDASEAMFTTKVVGYQWYWGYSNNLSAPLNEDLSYMVQPESAREDSFRLLDTTGYLALWVDVPFRILVTSSDVLHSWTVPALGVKVDACPGRLNEIIIHPNRPGTFFGQCSEICGSNHSYMPIEVKSFSWADGMV